MNDRHMVVRLPKSADVTCTLPTAYVRHSDRLRQRDIQRRASERHHQHAPVPRARGALGHGVGRGVGYLGRGVHRHGAVHWRPAVPDGERGYERLRVARRRVALRADREDRGEDSEEDDR